MEWQPIETVPKDGTMVIVFQNSGEFTHVCPAWWSESGYDDYTDGCLVSSDNKGYGRPCWVTHWMPLPEPPKDNKS